MFVLVEGGEVFGPEPLGMTSVLVVNGTIGRVGPIAASDVRALGMDVEVVSARDAFVVPGLLDPHEHLLGGSGERGFASQTPEIFLSEVVTAGITTVVGCLGVDTTTKTMTGLLAKARAFREEGVTAHVYSGGYDVPPVTLTGSLRRDMLLVDEVIGGGEVAIADERGCQPSVEALARLASEAYVGGILTGKAGVLHLHVGDGPAGLEPLRRVLADHDVRPDTLYPTHVERSAELMAQGVELTRAGVTIDLDTVEEDLTKWVRFFVERGGDLSRITASSDAGIKSPRTLVDQVRGLVRERVLPLDQALRLVTSNTARVLKLPNKGALRPGADGDLVVLERGSLEVRDVIVGGRRLVQGGKLVAVPKFLERSNRSIEARGQRGAR